MTLCPVDVEKGEEEGDSEDEDAVEGEEGDSEDENVVEAEEAKREVISEEGGNEDEDVLESVVVVVEALVGIVLLIVVLLSIS